jgi:hypothetical protein
MSMLQDLIGIRKLLELPERWTQDTAARDKRGQPIFSDDKDAVQFCLMGAVQLITKTEYKKTEPIALLFEEILQIPAVVAWNDSFGREHWEVLQLLDKAIAKAEEWDNLTKVWPTEPFPPPLCVECVLEDA